MPPVIVFPLSVDGAVEVPQIGEQVKGGMFPPLLVQVVYPVSVQVRLELPDEREMTPHARRELALFQTGQPTREPGLRADGAMHPRGRGRGRGLGCGRQL